jgi:hypothetical protein
VNAHCPGLKRRLAKRRGKKVGVHDSPSARHRLAAIVMSGFSSGSFRLTIIRRVLHVPMIFVKALVFLDAQSFHVVCMIALSEERCVFFQSGSYSFLRIERHHMLEPMTSGRSDCDSQGRRPDVRCLRGEFSLVAVSSDEYAFMMLYGQRVADLHVMIKENLHYRYERCMAKHPGEGTSSHRDKRTGYQPPRTRDHANKEIHESVHSECFRGKIEICHFRCTPLASKRA